MTPWSERSPEVAALLNPAFCGLLLYSAVDGYLSHGGQGMPYSLGALVLPVVLHKPSSDVLPNSIRTPFQSWVASTPTLRVGFADRVRAVVPVTRESLSFLLLRGCLTLTGERLLKGDKKPRLSAARTSPSDDIRSSVQAAALFGRLLARAGRPATVYASLGVAP